MVKKREYEGYTFLLDDSKGCYIEVTFNEQMGYVGVNLTNGTPEAPYSWSTPSVAGDAAEDGITGGIQVSGTLENCLTNLLRHLIQQRRMNDARKQFEPEKACEELHEYFKELEDS